MASLRRRLLVSHLLPILIAAPLLFFGLAYLLETQVLLNDLASDLAGRAQLLAQVVRIRPELITDPEEARQFLSNLDLDSDEQIVIIDAQGNVLAASQLSGSPAPGEPIELEGLDGALAGEGRVLLQYDLLRQSGQVLLPVVDTRAQLLGVIAVSQTLEGLASDLSRLRGLLLIVLLIEVLLAGGIAVLLALRLGGPLDRAAGSVIAIAFGDDVEPLEEEGPREVRQLSAAVNLLALRLRELEETRRRSLANIVHELGRPLGAIRAALHVLQGAPGEDPETRRELMQGIEQEVIQLQPLLDDLAQLHGQVTGEVKLRLEPVALKDWLPSMLIPWRAAALEKGLAWEADISADLPLAILDPTRMSQAIGNLLSNAVKYTPQNGRIDLQAGAEASLWRLEIRDSGSGIDAEEQEKIFEAFYRGRGERRFPQGLGLGLTIARSLIEAHGGSLVLESRTDEGSRFMVLVPLEPPAAENAVAASDELLIGEA